MCVPVCVPVYEDKYDCEWRLAMPVRECALMKMTVKDSIAEGEE